MSWTTEETLIEATERLAQSGDTDAFVPDRGCLRSLATGRRYALSELTIDALQRFEGATDPDEEAVLLGLRASSDGVRGTLALPFGPRTDPESAAILSDLRSARGST